MLFILRFDHILKQNIKKVPYDTKFETSLGIHTGMHTLRHEKITRIYSLNNPIILRNDTDQ